MTAHLEVRIGANRVAAILRRRGKVIWQGEAPFGSESLPDQVAVLARSALLKRRTTHAILVLEPPLLQRRSLADLPPVSEKALQQLIARATGRYFRQNGHPLICSARWAAGATGARTAEAIAVDGELVSSLLAALAAQQLVVDDVIPGDRTPGLSLLPPDEQRRRHRLDLRKLLRLGLGVAALWLIVGAAATLRLVQESRTIDRELAQLAVPIAALQTARRSLDSAGAMVTAVVTDEYHRRDMVERLLLLTRKLPDSAVFTTLRLDEGDGVRLSGYSTEGSRIAAALGVQPQTTSGRSGEAAIDSLSHSGWIRFTLSQSVAGGS